MDDQDPQKDKQNMVTLASTPEGVQSDYISDKLSGHKRVVCDITFSITAPNKDDELTTSNYSIVGGTFLVTESANRNEGVYEITKQIQKSFAGAEHILVNNYQEYKYEGVEA